jgi:hypothetical protein
VHRRWCCRERPICVVNSEGKNSDFVFSADYVYRSVNGRFPRSKRSYNSESLLSRGFPIGSEVRRVGSVLRRGSRSPGKGLGIGSGGRYGRFPLLIGEFGNSVGSLRAYSGGVYFVVRVVNGIYRVWAAGRKGRYRLQLKPPISRGFSELCGRREAKPGFLFASFYPGFA